MSNVIVLAPGAAHTAVVTFANAANPELPYPHGLLVTFASSDHGVATVNGERTATRDQYDITVTAGHPALDPAFALISASLTPQHWPDPEPLVVIVTANPSGPTEVNASWQ